MDKGSTFTVFLPISNKAIYKKPERDTKQISYSSTLPPKSLINSHSIHLPIGLIIEDNIDVQNYICSCLQGHYRLQLASNGEEGLNKALEIVPDFIISDVMMPVMDGFTLCNAFKNK